MALLSGAHDVEGLVGAAVVGAVPVLVGEDAGPADLDRTVDGALVDRRDARRAGVGPQPLDGAHGTDGSHQVAVVERGGLVAVAAVSTRVRLPQDPGQLAGEGQAGAVVAQGRLDRAVRVPPCHVSHVGAHPSLVRVSLP